jgi:geranylgeranyl diphosphate synthase type II
MANDRIETALSEVLDRITKKPSPPKMSAALRHAVLDGGARVRPKLCLAVAYACGDQHESRLAAAAAASIELIHCASLVHDDLPCFDDADLRRGKPSVHAAYGEPLAVLSGDALIVAAFETLARCSAGNPIRANSLIVDLALATGAPNGICAGQGWESEADIDLAAYHRSKTGALFVAATRMGARSMGEDPDPWTTLGAKIGEAFQVADDLRDALLDSEQLGKPAGQDAVHDRPNAVAHLGVDGAVKLLDSILEGALEAIPPCDGDKALRAIVRQQAERLVPVGVARTVA